MDKKKRRKRRINRLRRKWRRELIKEKGNEWVEKYKKLLEAEWQFVKSMM